jgi:hypothetical protein
MKRSIILSLAFSLLTLSTFVFTSPAEARCHHHWRNWQGNNNFGAYQNAYPYMNTYNPYSNPYFNTYNSNGYYGNNPSLLRQLRWRLGLQ